MLLLRLRKIGEGVILMRKIYAFILIVGGLLFTPVVSLAAPFNADGNPQIVANYDSGEHGVVGETETHTGADVVMRAGESGNFQQWFYGTSTEDGGITEGDHSIWKLSEDGACNGGATAMTVNSENFWGDYLVEGGTYCIKTNDFHSSENHTP